MVEFVNHQHDELVHSNEHIHVAHHVKGGFTGNVEHLTSVHQHGHHHAPLEHAHEPHGDFEREHSHEMHIHDHSDPARD